MAIVCDSAEDAAAIMKAVVRKALRISVVLLYGAEFEIRAPLFSRVAAIEEQRAVDPNLFGFGVDAERIAGPKHHVRVLPDFDRSDLIFKPECPGRIDRQPLDRLILGDVDSSSASRVHRFRNFLIESLRPE